MRRLLPVLLVIGLVPVHAGTLGEEAWRQCRARAVPAQVCDIFLETEDGVARTGLTAGDFTEDGPRAPVDVADFYFAPRIAIVRDGQTIVFRNDNPPGGNRHSIASADWGGRHPVWPLPLASFGGGRAFRSGVLDPGTTFELRIDVASMNPDAAIPLPNGDMLIGYFCYIHGASQMNGQLLVTDTP